MASNKERIRFLMQTLKSGQYRQILQLMKSKLSGSHAEKSAQTQGSTDLPSTVKVAPEIPESQSNFATKKQHAISSFMTFLDGGEQPEFPLEVFIEVSNLCDLQCAMCHTFSALNPKRFNIISSRHRGFFNTDLIENKMATVLEHALVVHAFGYGEPTLHPQFIRMLDILDKYEVMVDFFTHGMHLDDELCTDLVNKRISKVTISFSGTNKDDYENVYIGGEFEQVLAGIKRLSKLKKEQHTEFPLIVINSLAFKHHVEKLPEFVRIMGKAGANVIHLKPFKTYDIIQELHGHASVHHPDKEGVILAQAKDIARQYGIRLESADYESDKDDEVVLKSRHMGTRALSSTTVPIQALKSIAQEKRNSGGLGEKAKGKIDIEVPQVDEVVYHHYPNMTCMEPFKTLYFGYEGAAYPCCYKHIMWGDIEQQDAEQIWKSELMHSLRDHVARQEYPTDLCHGCIKTGLYPKANAARMYSIHYSRWFEDKFKQPFYPALIEKVKALPDSREIFEQFLSGQTGVNTKP